VFVGKLVLLSHDHKPWDAVELERIEAAGCYVRDHRVDGQLAVSRAVGDLDFKRARKSLEEQAVTSVPEIIEEKRHADDEFLVVACDGLWDVLGNESVLEFVATRDLSDLSGIAQALVSYAVEIGSMDNVTAVIMGLK
jgi:serine/threonine protein phosphatase PrpC